MKKTVLLAILAVALSGAAFAQTAGDDALIPPVPYTAGGNARFFPVAKDLIVPPGGHVVQILNVFGLDRASVQAVAHSTIGDMALHVRVGFGPPHVFEPTARLDLTFVDADTARASEITPIRGPRMSVVLDNDRAVPVVVSVGVYATH